MNIGCQGKQIRIVATVLTTPLTFSVDVALNVTCLHDLYSPIISRLLLLCILLLYLLIQIFSFYYLSPPCASWTLKCSVLHSSCMASVALSQSVLSYQTLSVFARYPPRHFRVISLFQNPKLGESAHRHTDTTM